MLRKSVAFRRHRASHLQVFGGDDEEDYEYGLEETSVPLFALIEISPAMY
jgi:hypothetical protein